MLRQTLLGLTNPFGGAYVVRAGWCRPLVKREGILWTLSQVETGAFAFVAPSFARVGGYLELVPVSFLVLRLRAAGVGYWSLPGFTAASYFDAGSYDFRWPSTGFANDVAVEAGQGGGINLSGELVLRASVSLKKLPKGPLELIVLNSFVAEDW